MTYMHQGRQYIAFTAGTAGTRHRRSWWRSPYRRRRNRLGLRKTRGPGSSEVKQGRPTFNAELAEIAEKFFLCVLSGLCVDRCGYDDTARDS